MVLGPLSLLSVGGEQKLIEVTIEEIPTVSVKTKPRFLLQIEYLLLFLFNCQKIILCLTTSWCLLSSSVLDRFELELFLSHLFYLYCRSPYFSFSFYACRVQGPCICQYVCALSSCDYLKAFQCHFLPSPEFQHSEKHFIVPGICWKGIKACVIQRHR